MKKPWKKNLMKLPEDVFQKLENFDDDFIVVGVAKEMTEDEINSGLYQHLGIEFIDGELSYVPNILPNPKIGRYSNYNINGRTFPLKDLPKIDKTFTNELPIFGDWSKGSNSVSWTRKVWQTERWLPKFLRINIELLKREEQILTFKFTVDIILNKKSEQINKELLYCCNIIKENTGSYDIFTANAPNDDYLNSLIVGWELLPVGTQDSLERNVEYLLQRHRNPNEKLKNVYIDRMDFFYNTLGAKNILTGTDGFNRYFGALLNNDTVLLENSNYGNAVYIFYRNWEELSQLSRIELLSLDSNDFERITHFGNWKNKIVTAIRNH